MWTQEAKRRHRCRGDAKGLQHWMSRRPWPSSGFPPTPARGSPQPRPPLLAPHLVGGAPEHMRIMDRRSEGWRRELTPCNWDELIWLFFQDELILEYNPLQEQLYPTIPQPNTIGTELLNPHPIHPLTKHNLNDGKSHCNLRIQFPQNKLSYITIGGPIFWVTSLMGVCCLPILAFFPSLNAMKCSSPTYPRKKDYW